MGAPRRGPRLRQNGGASRRVSRGGCVSSGRGRARDGYGNDLSRRRWRRGRDASVSTLTRPQGAHASMTSKNVICLWFNKDAQDAARFYAATFPDSEVVAVHKAPGDYPSGKEGDVLTVEFTVMGIPCLGLNGGPAFTHSEAFSFQV